MSVKQLVTQVASAPNALGKRKISAIIGALVADAASLPLEWIYDEDKMKEIIGTNNPEFWPESKCPFYTVPTGNVSCYGDELLTTLSTLSETGGSLNVAEISTNLQSKFGDPSSPYQIALAKRAKKVYPVEGPWINGGVIKFLANVKDGKNPPGSDSCEDNDGLAVSMPVIFTQQGQAEEVCKLLTTNETAVNHHVVQSSILIGYLELQENPIESAKAKFADKLPEITQEIEAVLEAVKGGKSLNDIVDNFGKACGLPGSFQGALAALLKENDYVSAVRGNIVAGGDCNARAIFIGACLGGKLGIENIPMNWIEKVNGVEKILNDAIKVYLN